MKEKIIVVNPTSIFGGGEVYLYNLLSKVDGCNRKNYIILCASIKLSEKLKDLEFDTVPVDDATSLSLNTISLIKKINNFIKSNKIKSVFLNGLSEVGVYARYIKHKKIYAVAHSNEFWLDERPFMNFKHFLKRGIIYNFDRYLERMIFVNNVAFNNARGYGQLIDKSVVIYNGVPEIDIKEKTKPESNDVIIGRIGRLTEGKGNEFLIEAFSRFVSIKSDNRYKLLFAGEGSERSKLEKLVEDNKLTDHVKFVGLVSPTEFYSNIDVMFSPSLMEATPLVIAEAMSCRVPVISTSVGGCSEMIAHNRTGYLIEPGSVQAILEALLMYTENRTEFESFSFNAYESYLDTFSLDTMIRKLISAKVDIF